MQLMASSESLFFYLNIRLSEKNNGKHFAYFCGEGNISEYFWTPNVYFSCKWDFYRDVSVCLGCKLFWVFSPTTKSSD